MLQESVTKTDIIAFFSSDHSLILFALKILLSNERFVFKMKNHIAMSLETLDKENTFNDQMKWEFIKFLIIKFSICYSIFKSRNR